MYKYYETVEGYCKTALWKLYHAALPIAWFSIQVVSESSNTILDSLEFSKNAEVNPEERKTGEIRLQDFIEKIGSRTTEYPGILCDFSYGFGCDCTVKVYVSDWK